jgi:acyl-CoA synthetase (AMP-forming)/AMP-acid ligase II
MDKHFASHAQNERKELPMILPGSKIGALSEPLTGRYWDAGTVINRIASRVTLFRSLGMGVADRVLILHGNDLEFFIELLAIWQVGACAIPIDDRLAPYEIDRIRGAAHPRFATAPASFDGSIVSALSQRGIVMMDAHADGDDGTPDPSPGMVSLDDAALILFTSGTTGNPKGVVHTHRSLQARWALLHQCLGERAYRRSLCVLPTHFGHGLICNCLFPWLQGAELFIAPSFNMEVASTLGRIIDENAISFLSSVPALWRLVLKVSGPPKGGSLQRIHCGSAPLSEDLWRQIREWSQIDEVYNSYGITETGSWTAGTSIDGLVPEDGLIGYPWGASIKVCRDATVCADEIEVCGAGEEGYIWLSTPALMKGYLDREDLTRDVVKNGWFTTGDIGLIDERGYLYLRGRSREEINKGGMKIYPTDVDLVAENSPGVSDVCTFAIHDALYGQDVGIALVIKGNPKKVVADLKKRMCERLARHKIPVRWYLLDEIPRTSRGKINRAAVAKICNANSQFQFLGDPR